MCRLVVRECQSQKQLTEDGASNIEFNWLRTSISILKLPDQRNKQVFDSVIKNITPGWVAVEMKWCKTEVFAPLLRFKNELYRFIR